MNSALNSLRQCPSKSGFAARTAWCVPCNQSVTAYGHWTSESCPANDVTPSAQPARVNFDYRKDLENSEHLLDEPLPNAAKSNGNQTPVRFSIEAASDDVFEFGIV
jgi:hypothetical protein